MLLHGNMLLCRLHRQHSSIGVQVAHARQLSD